MFAKTYRLLLPLLFFILISPSAQTARPQGWSVRLDGGIQFYQSTELGVLLVGTERSLYAVDGETGETLWRRKNLRVDETDVTPVVGTDLALVNLEKSGKSRIEAVDVFTGTPVWKSEKIKGSVMQLAVDPQRERIALVMVREPFGNHAKTQIPRPGPSWRRTSPSWIVRPSEATSSMMSRCPSRSAY